MFQEMMVSSGGGGGGITPTMNIASGKIARGTDSPNITIDPSKTYAIATCLMYDDSNARNGITILSEGTFTKSATVTNSWAEFTLNGSGTILNISNPYSSGANIAYDVAQLD